MGIFDNINWADVLTNALKGGLMAYAPQEASLILKSKMIEREQQQQQLQNYLAIMKDPSFSDQAKKSAGEALKRLPIMRELAQTLNGQDMFSPAPQGGVFGNLRETISQIGQLPPGVSVEAGELPSGRIRVSGKETSEPWYMQNMAPEEKTGFATTYRKKLIEGTTEPEPEGYSDALHEAIDAITTDQYDPFSIFYAMSKNFPQKSTELKRILLPEVPSNFMEAMMMSTVGNLPGNEKKPTWTGPTKKTKPTETIPAAASVTESEIPPKQTAAKKEFKPVKKSKAKKNVVPPGFEDVWNNLSDEQKRLIFYLIDSGEDVKIIRKKLEL